MALIGRNIGRALRRFYIAPTTIARQAHGGQTLSEEETDKKYVSQFLSPNTDGFKVRSLMNDLHGSDAVPSPNIVDAGLRACRRINDYALAVRFLESVRMKCGNKVNVIWPYIVQEIKPTLEELGVDTPEQLGYDKPELYLKCQFYDK